jgi:hypothetical protein
MHLAQPLMRGWDSVVTLDPVHRAQHSVASSERSLEQARVNAALEAIAAYYTVLREQRLAAFAAAQLRRIDEHTRGRREQGALRPHRPHGPAARARAAEGRRGRGQPGAPRLRRCP